MASYPRLRRLLWSALLLAALLVIAIQSRALFAAIQAGATTSSDFCPDYVTARHWLEGIHIYTPTACWSRFTSTPQPVEYDSHPPPSLLLIVPFAWLSYPAASWLWGLFDLACLILSLLIVCREVGLWTWRGVLPLLALFLLWEPTLDSTRSANIGAGATSLLLILTWHTARRGQQRWAGVLAGTVILVKLVPVLLFPYFLLRRQTQATIATGITLALGIGLSLALMGPQPWTDYLGPVRVNESFAVSVPGNLSLEALVVRWSAGYHEFLHLGAVRAFTDLPPLFPALSLNAALLLGLLVGGCALLILSFWLWKPASAHAWGEADDASFAFLLVLTFLVFPRAWYWSLILLATPLLWLAMQVWRQRHSKSAWPGGAAVVLLAIPFSWYIPAFHIEAETSAPWPLRLAAALFTTLPTIALILLLAALMPWLKTTTQALTGQSVAASSSSSHLLDRNDGECYSGDTVEQTGKF